MAQRGVLQRTLEKKLGRWKKHLRLTDWDITIRYGTKKEVGNNTLACLDTCSHAEKIARVIVSKDYFKDEDFAVVWNLDTLILHELIHIVLKAEEDKIPESIRNHKRVHNLIEFTCDTFAKTIFDIKHKKM